MKTGKRFLSLLLSGMMLFSLWPQTALAEGAQDSGTQGFFFSEEYDAQKCTGTGEGFAACEDTKTEIATLSNARAADTAHDISQSTLTISQNGSYTVTGTTTTNCIIVNSGVTATITLDGVNITAPEYQSAIDVKDNANLTIILQDNTTSTLVGGFATGSHGAPGIHVPSKATVTIQGGGELNVTGGGSGSSHGGAGIGGKAGSGPVRPEDCGTVMILGGTVSITGGSTGSGSFSGVGIGGGSYTQDIGGAGGTVIILGGSVSVTSGKGGSGTADIGAGGANYHGASDGQGIKPAGDSTYTVYGNLTLPCDITIPDGATVTIPEGTSLTVPEGVKLTNNGSITGAGSVIVNGDVSGSGSMSVTGTVTKKDQDAPDAPGSTTNVTDTSVTLRPVTTSDGGGGIEYGYTTGDETSVPEERWQSGTTFSNLAAATPYTFYARRAGNAYYKPSPASAVGLTVTTLPAAPESSAVAIDYAAETISFDSDTLEMGTSEDITSGTAISSGSSIVSHMGQTVYVRFKANGGIPASAPVEINIPARPAAPALTIDNQAEGVTLSSEYYYSTTGVDYNTWTQGDGSLVKIEPGSSIYIYKAAVASGADAAFKSAVQTLTAPARGNRPNVPAIDYEAEALTGTTTAMEYTLEQSTPGRWTACTEGMALSADGWNSGRNGDVSWQSMTYP